MFETEKEVLDWYERQPRALDAEFARGFPWDEVGRHRLDPSFVPVLRYMRDVESYTEVYYRELRRTPTGKDPVIRRFMERWRVEEDDHAAALNRFLAEAGVPAGDRWREEARSSIPLRYTVESYATTLITNLFGKGFSGTHMVWGAINELTTLQGYRRLWQTAGHPALELLLRAIAREESAHAKFYWSIARLRLERSPVARELARFAVRRFWGPVGRGAKPQAETDYLIRTLFGGTEGVAWFDKHVTRRIENLPGFAGLKTMTDRIASIAAEGACSAA